MNTLEELLLSKPDPDSRAKVSIDPRVLDKVQRGVAELLKNFPLYPELVID